MPAPPTRRRRLRAAASRLGAALPVWAQIGGLAAIEAGVYLMTGLPWSLIAGGVMILGAGALKEGKVI